MRNIKFRGKRKDNGKWVYGYFLVNQFDEYTICDKTFAAAVMPETVGCSTGFYDLENREIYQDDILRFSCFNYEVIWHDDTGSWGCKPIQQEHYITTTKALFEILRTEDCSTIGNKIDNPELLEN